MFPFSPVFCILQVLLPYSSRAALAFWGKILLVTKHRQLQHNKNDGGNGLDNNSLNNMANLSYNSSEYLLYNEGDSFKHFHRVSNHIRSPCYNFSADL